MARISGTLLRSAVIFPTPTDPGIYASRSTSVKCRQVILTIYDTFRAVLRVRTGGRGKAIPPDTSPHPTAPDHPSPPAGAPRAPSPGTAPRPPRPRWWPPARRPDTSTDAAPPATPG